MVDILLVEDNTELGTLIAGFLRKDGYQVQIADTGEKALGFLKSDTAKLVLLDIMLPGIDGFAVCRLVREHGATPIIIMSAVVGKEDKMKGYELGADDYIEKPVDIDILRAKLKAVLTRNYSMPKTNRILSAGDLTIDQDAMQVFLKGEAVDLNVKEYELLFLLAENSGKTLNKDYIFDKIWGADSFSENQTLTVHIKRIRDKIEEDPKNPIRIKTVWGVGYKYEEV